MDLRSLLHIQALETRAKCFFPRVDLVGRFLLSEITCNCVIQFTWVVNARRENVVKIFATQQQTKVTNKHGDRERRAAAKLLSFYSYSDLSRCEDFGTIGRLDWW
jgi:hypothetical protein